MTNTKTRDSRGPARVITFLVALLACSCFLSFFPARAATNLMFLTVTDYEEGNSYRKLEIHNPIGMLNNPCSYADYMSATIDWNDGSGEHKPDTNAQTKLFSNKTPVIQDGMYLFWDDAHVPAGVGTHIVTTRLSLHCLGDPPGNQVYTAQNTVNVFARIPVNQVSFTKNDSAISTIKGHEVTDITITLNAPAPASGTWVHLETTPPGALNSLPAFFRISPTATQEKITNLEVRKPASMSTVTVSASTVGKPQQTQELTINP